jgi:hypothetical protein
MANALEAGKDIVLASVLQEVLREKFVGELISNTKFENDFKGGKEVRFTRQTKITTLPLASSYDAVTLQDIVQIEETFTLGQRTHFAYEVSIEDEVELKVDPNSQALQDVAEEFARDFDDSVMGQYVNAGFVGDNATLLGGAAGDITLTSANIYEVIVNIKRLMDENNMPMSDRFIVLSPKEEVLLNLSPDVNKNTVKGDTIVEQAVVNTIAGIRIITSNGLVVETATRHILAGAGNPISFAANVRPFVEITPSASNATKFVNTYKGMTKYDSKVFFEGANRLIDVTVVA